MVGGGGCGSDHHDIGFLSAILARYSVAFSISAAHRAAPTVFVKENAIEAKGTISRTYDAIPSLLINQHELIRAEWEILTPYTRLGVLLPTPPVARNSNP